MSDNHIVFFSAAAGFLLGFIGMMFIAIFGIQPTTYEKGQCFAYMQFGGFPEDESTALCESDSVRERILNATMDEIRSGTLDS